MPLGAPKRWDVTRAMVWGACIGGLFAAFMSGHEWVAAAAHPNHINVSEAAGGLLGGVVVGAVLGGFFARFRNWPIR